MIWNISDDNPPTITRELNEEELTVYNKAWGLLTNEDIVRLMIYVVLLASGMFFILTFELTYVLFGLILTQGVSTDALIKGQAQQGARTTFALMEAIHRLDETVEDMAAREEREETER